MAWTKNSGEYPVSQAVTWWTSSSVRPFLTALSNSRR